MTGHPAGSGHDLTAIPAAELRRARLMSVLVGVTVPLMLSVVVLLLLLSWLPELPSPVVTHWGPAGADGFGPPAVFAWMTVLLGFVLPAGLTIGAVLAAGEHWGGAARLLGALALGISGLSAVITLGGLGMQRGLGDAKQVGHVGGVILLGFGLFIVMISIGWIAQPRVRALPSAPLQPAHVTSITQGERVVWLATASMPPAALLAVSLLAVIVVGITAVMAIRFTDRLWVPVLTLLLIGGALAVSASFRVRVGPDGLSVRSQAGFPRVHVPLDEIVSVRAVQCSPFGEFGGFGWRVGLDGRTGIVLRRGPAIEVERRDKRPLVVTVNGAEVAVAVLQAYLARSGDRMRPGSEPDRSRS